MSRAGADGTGTISRMRGLRADGESVVAPLRLMRSGGVVHPDGGGGIVVPPIPVVEAVGVAPATMFDPYAVRTFCHAFHSGWLGNTKLLQLTLEP